MSSMSILNVKYGKGDEFGCADVFVKAPEVVEMPKEQWYDACCRVMTPFVFGTDDTPEGFMFNFDMSDQMEEFEDEDDAVEAMKWYIDDAVSHFEEAVFMEKWDSRAKYNVFGNKIAGHQ